VRPFNFRLALFGVGQRVEEAEKLLAAGDGQGGVDAVADADQGERASILIMGDVGADQSADAGGVDVENPGEIHDEVAASLARIAAWNWNRVASTTGP
jgi:hypothetical protein